MTRVLLTVAEAAEVSNTSADTLRKAIRATEPNAFPPPLRAKRGAKGRYLILPADLQEWAESLEDA